MLVAHVGHLSALTSRVRRRSGSTYEALQCHLLLSLTQSGLRCQPGLPPIASCSLCIADHCWRWLSTRADYSLPLTTPSGCFHQYCDRLDTNLTREETQALHWVLSIRQYCSETWCCHTEKVSFPHCCKIVSSRLAHQTGIGLQLKWWVGHCQYWRCSILPGSHHVSIQPEATV